MIEIEIIKVRKDGFMIESSNLEEDPSYKYYAVVFNQKRNYGICRKIAEYIVQNKAPCPQAFLINDLNHERATIYRGFYYDLTQHKTKTEENFGYVLYRIFKRPKRSELIEYNSMSKVNIRKTLIQSFIHGETIKTAEGKEEFRYWLGDLATTEIKFELDKSVTEYGITAPKGQKEDQEDSEPEPTSRKSHKASQYRIRGIHTAPTAEGFVGREKELCHINNAWESKEAHLVSITAWGGFGKSVLAKQWIDRLKKDSSIAPQPERGLWWSFYENDSIDAFLEMALAVFSDDFNVYNNLSYTETKFDALIQVLSSESQPTILVLDGFEDMQHHEAGDYFGKCRDYQLAHFIQRICAGECQNLLCIITSRIKISDVQLPNSKTHINIDLENSPLSLIDSVALLRNHGVQGSEEELGNIAQDHGGHPLALVTIASLLSEFFRGDSKTIESMPSVIIPQSDIGDRFKLWRIFSWYNSLLKPVEKEVLQAISIFRQRAPWDLLSHILKEKDKSANQAENTKLKFICSHLHQLKLIQYDFELDSYSMHPLLKQFFMQTTSENMAIQINESLFDLLQTQADYQPAGLTEMAPLIEAVYHGCRCGKPVEALNVFRERIERKSGYLTKNLSSWGVKVDLCEMFFSEKRFTGKCFIEDTEQQGHLLNAAGYAHMNMGRPDKAVALFKRSIEKYIEAHIKPDTAQVYRNLSDASLRLGHLDEAVTAAVESLKLDSESKSQQSGLGYLGYAYALLGSFDKAIESFDQALTLFGKNWLPPVRGIQFVEMLIMKNDLKKAIATAKKMKKFSEDQDIKFAVADSNRVLGMAIGWNAIASKNSKSAKESLNHLIKSLDLASTAGVHYYNFKTILDATQMQIALAIENLHSLNKRAIDKIESQINEVLNISQASFYKLIEAEAFYTRASLWFLENNISKARSDNEKALNIALHLKYKWLSNMCSQFAEKL